jgi:hypothetical protein
MFRMQKDRRCRIKGRPVNKYTYIVPRKNYYSIAQ